MRALVESVGKEDAEEVLVEGAVELVLALLFLHFGKFVREIVGVEVQEALLLDEVAEHQAVQHDGRVPFAVRLVDDAEDALHEGVVLDAELAVELLGDVGGIDLEHLVQPVENVHRAWAGANRELDFLELAEEEVSLCAFLVFDADERTLVGGLHGNHPEVVHRLALLHEDGDIGIAKLAKPGIQGVSHGGLRQGLHLAHEHADEKFGDLVEDELGRHGGRPSRADFKTVRAVRGRAVPTRLVEERGEVSGGEKVEKLLFVHYALPFVTA